MESTISYFVIGILILISVIVYNIRKKQTRNYQLSVSIYPEAVLELKIKKVNNNLDSIIIDIKAVKKFEVKDLKVELITSKREFNYYSLSQLNENKTFPVTAEPDTHYEFDFTIDKFKSLLNTGEHPFRTFRFVIVTKLGKLFKTHELGFNKKWVIYRPDSGTYN